MSILTAYNLAQAFDRQVIFKGISAKIEHGNKIGLIGPNGVGKTSLLRILAGLERPTDGGAYRAGNIKLGYLHQEAVDTFASRANTVYAEMLTVFAGLRALEAQMATIEAHMATGITDELLATYGTLQATYEQQGGYSYETRIEQVLQGLDFDATNWHLPLSHLSGGQKTRALLARLLLEEPDLLMLDEPTNHLDGQAVAWLEKMLQGWPGALLVVSHDRYFLDKVAAIIWEMSPTEIEVYRGNYTAYTRQRAERWARRQVEFDATHERLSKEMDFIYKHIGSGRGHAMAMGKLRRISTELGSFRNTFKPAKAKAKIKELRRPAAEWAQMKVELAAAQQSGKLVLHTRDLIVGYDEPLFMTDDIQLQRGVCAALIGPNGAGKTTLLRTLLGELPPLSGTVQLGHNVRIGYFAQAHDNLNLERTVLSELLRQPGIDSEHTLDETAARNYLARYLFRANDVYKTVASLSGGERGRLALAILALQGANFLLLDEPTNHLDLPAQEVLQAILDQYAGTILLISHDRYLVGQLATEIWSLRDGQLSIFAGSYDEFVEQDEM